MPNLILKLEKPIVGHKPHRELTFREPTWSEFMKLGPCYRWIPRGDGSATAMPDNEVIAQYAEACLVAPGEPETLTQCSYVDAQKVADYFFQYGLAAERTAVESKMSSETSSKSSNGDPQTSAT